MFNESPVASIWPSNFHATIYIIYHGNIMFICLVLDLPLNPAVLCNEFHEIVELTTQSLPVQEVNYPVMS